MNEDETVQLEQADLQTADSNERLKPGGAGQPITAGALLRDARQARGLDIGSLAASLKVPVRKLQALEQDQFDQLPDSVFARALASSICRILHVDPLPVLERLPAIAAFKVTSQNRGINAPFRTRGGHGNSAWSHISRPVILVGVALLLGALLLIFVPLAQKEIASYRQQDQAVAAKTEFVESVSIAVPASTQVSDAGVGPADSPGVRVEPLQVIGGSSFIPTPSAVPASVSSVTATNGEAEATVTFKAVGESWVKVTDANGVEVLSRTLRSGESAGASGALPLKAVIGRADAIQVKVRGQAFGLGGVSKNNVARFEVK